MSFNRLNYDMCQYKQSIQESTGPGSYMLGTPPNNCDYCYPTPPTIRLQKGGDSIDRSRPLIDTDSELRTMKNSNVDPGSEPFKNPPEGLTHWRDCFHHTIESRHSDPASNLRGTGFDRWEYLCFNPQEKATIPFDYNISNRLIVKDNHRPCVPTPIDGKITLPPDTGNPVCEKTTPVCSAPTHPMNPPCKTDKRYYD